MTQKGETIKYSAADHVKAINDHLGTPCLDAILVNNYELPLPIQENYKEENAEPVAVDIEGLEQLGLEIIKKDIATVHSGVVRHESTHIADWLNEYAPKFLGK
ncbi:Gluconeogenesis factor OS=Ureibacillus acetophenoni OX=614649 GN=SAMN05877842_107100 PE=3 SV=1 [Ureibacillus acetophenoni]